MSGSLNRTKALKALESGIMLQHEWFQNDEWIRKDGVTGFPEEFRQSQTDISWLIGWSILKETSDG